MPETQLFGTDGVRGVANKYPVTPEVALRLGQAAATVFLKKAKAKGALDGKPTCILGRDTRASCDMLAAALTAGMNSVGVDVIDAGIVPTPAIAYLSRDMGAIAGAVISASHNPYGDNGIKFFAGTGYKPTNEDELEIENLTLATPGQDIERPTGGKIGRSRSIADGARQYIEFAKKSAGDIRFDGMKIALDNAHGAASFTSETILEELGAEVHAFHSEPDGININEDCGCTHPLEIQKLVSKTGAQVGLSHDGDADRILLIDEKGGILDGDDILGTAAIHLIPKGELVDNTVVATIMSNYGLNALLEELGGKVERTGVGDRNVIAAMRKGGYNVGGEQSGHLIFRDYNTTGDGIISALQILKIMAETGKPLSELRSRLKKFPQAQRNLPVKSKPPIDQLTEAQKIIEETNDALSGAGRTLLRYSGTEPKIRLLVEGREVDYLEKQADKIASAILEQIG